jgi:ketosteroid isomerase-like protein
VSVVERGYEAVAAGDRETLLELFPEDAIWELMDRDEVARTFTGRDAVVDFLLRIREVRLEAIMSVRGLVVAAHSFALRSGARVTATTVYELREDVVLRAACSDIRF